eukprot:Gregarina_sp_Poly_1__8498@NODE_500_length_7882_cov_255_800640_g400_i0_p2_GENE_NODE_500_length_7882_cov_255_800640_g400_i0NODE_500_length_7882_cov_255_800640_g400_i0_p2_ORF_typecomplete_len207_score17_67_NODE_500_length_7882_cov_255_800640_g400_i019602580
MMQTDIYRAVLPEGPFGAGAVTQTAKPVHCLHKPRYRLCLAAALGMTTAAPSTALPCDECEQQKLDLTESRWRTSSAASSQGGVSTRAPTACEEDRVSWSSSSLGHSSSSSGFATSGLVRTSSSATSEYPVPAHACGQYFCPTPSQRFNGSFESEEPRLKDEARHSALPGLQETACNVKAPFLSHHYSPSLLTLAISHAASFVYEE